MAAVKYSIHETPTSKKEGKKTYHARPIGGKIIRMDEIETNINSMSSFSSADIKGLLEALSNVLIAHLQQGHTVELEGIGSFNISIFSPRGIENPSKINASNIRFKKVNFKSSSKLNKALKSTKFERSDEFRKKVNYTEKERLERILSYIESNGYIQSSTCMGVNDCSRYIALKDLKQLVDAGKLICQGKRASCLYLQANSQ
jgi:predicted histone-like DNA-binding protein